MKKKEFSLLNVIIIVIFAAITAGIASGVIIKNSYKYDKLEDDKVLSEFLDVYSRVSKDYYEDVNKNKMLDKAVEGMLSSLDDSYTDYLDSGDSAYLEATLNGTFKGIGVTFSNKKIIDVIYDSPAKKAGLLAGDIIVSINDTPVANLSDTDMAKIIKDDKDDKINMVISRDGKEINVDNIEIRVMPNYYLSANMIEDTSIGYIRLPIFSLKSGKQFLNKVSEFENNGMNKLIIDLRSNTGGFLDEATEIVSAFVEKGKILYSLKDKKKTEYFYDKTAEKKDYPIVILIDENSASASEIVTSILKDNNNAIIVGKKSFGKGKVQKTITLSDGTMAKYTSAKWYRPNGECVDMVGINPDYEVDLLKEFDENGNVISIDDTQLKKAIEVIKGIN